MCSRNKKLGSSLKARKDTVITVHDRAGKCLWQIKNNRKLRRFLLRGLSKVSLEIVLPSLAHNLLKRATIKQKGRRPAL
ncbi:transposase [Paenibacillus sp. Dod16]|uniref:transposase n=1 Tax=Paenibacillus sp. Dod16 TaxID=3416392 RepID=UPI003CFA6546